MPLSGINACCTYDTNRNLRVPVITGPEHPDELQQLADSLQWAEEEYVTVLCFCNNESMFENADTLKSLLSK